MRPLYLVHYHEIALKGKNRPWFEKRLQENLRRSLETLGPARVRRLFGRIVIEGLEAADPAAVTERLDRVFGVASWSPAWEVDRSMESLAEGVSKALPARAFASFAVRARRSDKSFPIDSVSIGRELGAHVVRTRGFRVDLGSPELEIQVEVLHERILFYFEKRTGAGGLPVGVSGRRLCLLSGGIDSPVAAWRMLRRGATVDYVHFHSYPFTSRASVEKVVELAGRLSTWLGSRRVRMVPFGEIQQQIAAATPERLRILLYRRFMGRIASRIARNVRAGALVTGESLAQVASQTLENLAVFEDACELPVLRPLIGFDKNEIIAEARRIGTFELSILPHDDCCSFLLPSSPATRSTVAELQAAERALDVEALVAKGLAEAEDRDFAAVQSR